MIQLDNKLIPKGFFWVACSGGIDSIAGVDLLRKLNKGRVGVFHYNHNLRDQNKVMEAAVDQYASDFDLPYMSSLRPKKLDNTEAALHADRMAAYKQIGGDIVVCHHLDDAVESYIMNMIVGSPEIVPIPTQTFLSNTSYCIYRPFLKTRKSDFVDYVSRHNLMQYIVWDETNTDPTACRRNHIRHNIVPQFEGMGLPKVVSKKFYMSTRNSID